MPFADGGFPAWLCVLLFVVAAASLLMALIGRREVMRQHHERQQHATHDARAARNAELDLQARRDAEEIRAMTEKAFGSKGRGREHWG